MNIIERIDRPCEYVEVAQTALIACQYLYLWLFAGPDDAYKVYSLAILMAFEFVMVHSGLFMAAMPLKASIRLFIPLYGLFAFAFGHSMREGDYTIIILYLATVLNRMRFAFFNVSKSVKQRVVRQSMIALYNPQIQISAESETKRSIFREKDKTKRSKKESAQHSKSRNKSFVMTSVSAL